MADEAYASVADLVARWRTLSAEETEIAETLLGDVALYLDSLVTVDEEDEKQMERLKIVSCNVVKRMMASGTNDMFGVKQGTISADIYSQTFTYSNPSGDMYLTKQERKMLGIGQVSIGTIRAKVAGAYGEN